MIRPGDLVAVALPGTRGEVATGTVTRTEYGVGYGYAWVSVETGPDYVPRGTPQPYDVRHLRAVTEAERDAIVAGQARDVRVARGRRRRGGDEEECHGRGLRSPNASTILPP